MFDHTHQPPSEREAPVSMTKTRHLAQLTFYARCPSGSQSCSASGNNIDCWGSQGRWLMPQIQLSTSDLNIGPIPLAGPAANS
jgi:hypothetical protein